MPFGSELRCSGWPCPISRPVSTNLAAAGDMTWAAVTVRGTSRAVPGKPAADEYLGFSCIDTCRYVEGRIA